jgi:hypothetical protein
MHRSAVIIFALSAIFGSACSSGAGRCDEPAPGSDPHAAASAAEGIEDPHAGAQAGDGCDDPDPSADQRSHTGGR